MIGEITANQFKNLRKVGIFCTVGIDAAIDKLRKKYHIEIYNTAEPYVCPTEKHKGKTVYGYSVKVCNPKCGWNARQYVGHTNWYSNIYKAKRQAINISIKWILSHKSQKSKKPKIVAINASSKQKQD